MSAFLRILIGMTVIASGTLVFLDAPWEAHLIAPALVSASAVLAEILA